MTQSFVSVDDDINFCCAQDVNGYLANYDFNALNACEEKLVDKPQGSKSSLKSRKSLKKNTTSTSYVIRKTSRKGRNLIKIDIQPMNNSESENSVSVQYIVEDVYDEIMDATETVINKIVKRISGSSL